jgi:hypothetical protein
VAGSMYLMRPITKVAEIFSLVYVSVLILGVLCIRYLPFKPGAVRIRNWDQEIQPWICLAGNLSPINLNRYTLKTSERENETGILYPVRLLVSGRTPSVIISADGITITCSFLVR